MQRPLCPGRCSCSAPRLQLLRPRHPRPKRCGWGALPAGAPTPKLRKPIWQSAESGKSSSNCCLHNDGVWAKTRFIFGRLFYGFVGSELAFLISPRRGLSQKVAVLILCAFKCSTPAVPMRSDVEGLRDCEFLFASALGIDYFMLRGGSSDCVLVGVRIRSAGVAQLVAFKTPSSKCSLSLGSPRQGLAAAAPPCAVPCHVLRACLHQCLLQLQAGGGASCRRGVEQLGSAGGGELHFW
jgi:hypothetical protein